MPFLDEARGAVTRIIADADRASEVIRRIRALARKSDTRKARLNLNDVIDEAILLVRHEECRAIGSRRCCRELASGLPPVLGDQVQLQQVLINLVINGIQAMATVIDRRELLIRSRQEADQILVAVRDSGSASPPKKMSQVFETFFTTKPGGLGMGLSICRSIIEAHGGRLWASANDGGGPVPVHPAFDPAQLAVARRCVELALHRNFLSFSRRHLARRDAVAIAWPRGLRGVISARCLHPGHRAQIRWSSSKLKLSLALAPRGGRHRPRLHGTPIAGPLAPARVRAAAPTSALSARFTWLNQT